MLTLNKPNQVYLGCIPTMTKVDQAKFICQREMKLSAHALKNVSRLYLGITVIAFDVDQLELLEALVQDDVEKLVVLLVVGPDLGHEPHRDFLAEKTEETLNY